MFKLIEAVIIFTLVSILIALMIYAVTMPTYKYKTFCFPNGVGECEKKK